MIEHILHIFSNSCGEGSAMIAFIAEWPVIGLHASRFLRWAKARIHRHAP